VVLRGSRRVNAEVGEGERMGEGGKAKREAKRRGNTGKERETLSELHKPRRVDFRKLLAHHNTGAKPYIVQLMSGSF